MKVQLSLSSFALIAALATSLNFSTRADDAPPAKAPQWESTAQAGLTLTRGNSETLLAALAAGTAKKWNNNELSFGADGTYGTTTVDNTNTTTTANSLHGFGQYNRLFTERLYGLLRLDGLHDDIAEIRYRLTVSSGAGYYFVKNKTTDLSAEAGPGFVAQRLGEKVHDFCTLRLGEKFHHQLSDRARVWETLEYLPDVEHFRNYIVNFEVGIEADLTKDKKFTLRAFLQDTYNNVPAKGRKCNDAKLVTALAYKF